MFHSYFKHSNPFFLQRLVSLTVIALENGQSDPSSKPARDFPFHVELILMRKAWIHLLPRPAMSE